MDVLRQYWYENTDWLGLPFVDFSGGPGSFHRQRVFADFLLGDLGHFEQGGGESNAINAWMVAPYVADQIKVRPNLTLSDGLRWEPWISPVPVNGTCGILEPGATRSTRYPNAPSGMVFPGDRGVPSLVRQATRSGSLILGWVLPGTKSFAQYFHSRGFRHVCDPH